MITIIFYDSSGSITRVKRQPDTSDIPEGQLFLIDNSFSSPANVNWKAKKIENGSVVDRDDYVLDITGQQLDRRNSYLFDTDWTQVPDSPLTDTKKAEWATYRQALRDLTNHSNWPNLSEDDWPSVPS